MTNSSTRGCSGDNTIYVAPNNVSGLVVYTVILLFIESILKLTLAPSDLPIQFLCSSFTLSGQSKSSSPPNKDSA